LAIDNQDEGVRYLEARFAPQLHINEYMNMETVLMAVNKGLEKAQSEFNNRSVIKKWRRAAFLLWYHCLCHEKSRQLVFIL
jgi:adenosine deaminase